MFGHKDNQNFIKSSRNKKKRRNFIPRRQGLNVEGANHL